jgi:type II secretory pathway component PulF
MARTMQARTVLGYLEHAVRLNLPLTPFLAAAQESERGTARRQLAHLQDALQSGLPLNIALAQAVPYLPPDVLSTLAAAEPIGQLQPTLTRLVAAQRVRPIVDDAERIPYQRFYPLGLLLILTGMVGFFSIFVMPKFREIFKDFKVSLPPITEYVMGVSNFVADNVLVLLLLAVGLFAAIYVPMSFYLHRVFLPTWRLPDLGGVRDVLRWWTPILRGVERDRGMAATAEFLAQATAAGVPLPVAVERTLDLPTNPYFRARLRRWADFLETGEAPGTAAQRANLPELVGALLAPTSGDLSIPALFAFLARYYRQRFSRTLLLLRAALEPAVVLFFGALVLAFASAAIVPIVRLLNSVMGAYPGSYL